MSAEDEGKKGATAGYVSLESKQRFTATLAILAVISLVGQFILPFAAMALWFPFFLFQTFSWEAAGSHGTAFWEGRLWRIAPSFRWRRGPKINTTLQHSYPGSKEKPKVAADLEVDQPRLLAGDDRLWIISATRTGYYKDGRIVLRPTRTRLGETSKPFLYLGRPAVVEERLSKWILKVLRNDDWVEYPASLPRTRDLSRSYVSELQVAAVEGQLHFFLKHGCEVYHCQGKPRPGSETLSRWEPVTRVGQGWAAAASPDGLTVFSISQSGNEPRLQEYRLIGSRWVQITDYPLNYLAMGMNVYPQEAPDSFVIVLHSFPGRMKFIEIENGGIVQDLCFGRSFFSGFMVWPLWSPPPESGFTTV